MQILSYFFHLFHLGQHTYRRYNVDTFVNCSRQKIRGLLTSVSTVIVRHTALPPVESPFINMDSIAILPADTRLGIFSFLNAASRFAAVIAHQTIFVEGCLEKPALGMNRKVKEIKCFLEYISTTSFSASLVPKTIVGMKYAIADDRVDNFLQDAPHMWGLSDDDLVPDVLRGQMKDCEGQRCSCPFHDWLSNNNYRNLLGNSVDNLHQLNGEMKWVSRRDQDPAFVITFYDAATGIEGSCFAHVAFFDSDDFSEWGEEDEVGSDSGFDSDATLPW
jgi:hypothetical protein